MSLPEERRPDVDPNAPAEPFDPNAPTEPDPNAPTEPEQPAEVGTPDRS